MARPPADKPVLELRGVSAASPDGSMVSAVEQRLVGGEIACVLGDPAAGGRALLSFLAGQSRLLAGSIAVPEARPGRWTAPAAVRAGIGVAAGAAFLPGLPVWRSFVLVREPAFVFPPFRLLQRRRAVEIVLEELAKLGVGTIDPMSPPERLTASERSLLAVARAFWIGSRAVLLDEPTRGLGVEEAVGVLNRMLEARKAGVAVLFATSDVQHGWAVADRFLVLYRGKPLGSFVRAQTSREELYRLMLGNQDFEELAHELGGKGWERLEPEPPPPPARQHVAQPAASRQAPNAAAAGHVGQPVPVQAVPVQPVAARPGAAEPSNIV